MSLEDMRVYLTNPNREIIAERVLFRDNGWLGVNKDGDAWAYYPPQRVKSVLPNGD